MATRREFLRGIPLTLTGCVTALDAGAIAFTPSKSALASSHSIQLQPDPGNVIAPLDELRVKCGAATHVQVRDGNHQLYCDSSLEGELTFVVGGALGTHSVTAIDHNGSTIAIRTFRVDCKTSVKDEGGQMEELLGHLYWTMATDGPVGAMRYKGEVFTYWVSWLQDNTNTLKGMKYFWPEVKSNVDFYVASQREDGMVWENFEPRTPVETDWERRFAYGDFARPAEDGWLLLRRAPVENHVEHFLLEAIYFSWKASGDTRWMAAKLDAAIKAVHYATTDAYRWSEQYRLLKRGFTIDTWDFLCESEARLVGGDIMLADLNKTHFGVFFGDNANMIAGLRRLAEMLDAAGRAAESPKYLDLASDLEKRLNSLAWNGEFFVHWIPEDRNLKFDMGVDINRQVALSNAYSLNRGISHEQCAGIIRTYQRIQKEMPETSPGEFYAIYPPYERGFAREDAKWEYMNGGVMSCTAGELAWGAFGHGFEEYGADILKRYLAIARKHHGFVPGILRGKSLVAPKANFTQLDLRELANADIGAGVPGVIGWTGEPGNDLANMPTGDQTFRGIPFHVIDPTSNGQRACVAISSANGFTRRAVASVNQKARSFYLLHTKGGDNLVGKLKVIYDDGTTHWEYIQAGVNIDHWWAPVDSQFKYQYGPGGPERMQVAWRGANQKFNNVGVYVVGFDHPHPEKTVASLQFESLDTDAKWMILGVTLSDQPIFLPPWNDVSSGMPNNWGAAALVAAIIEGIAGVQDKGAAFNKARIAPRWLAAETRLASVSVRYPASQGYVRYNYKMDPHGKRAEIDFTGSAEACEVAVLLPSQASVKRVSLDGRDVPIVRQIIERSEYVSIDARGVGVHRVAVEFH